MDAAVIRLQLPAGAAFIPAFDDAADKYASRRDFADGGALFTAVASASVRAVASAAPSTIELVASERSGRITAVVRGQDPTAVMADPSIAAVKAASASISSTIDASNAVIEFSLPLG